MADQTVEWDLETLIQHFLGTSVPGQSRPTAVVLIGPPAVGKTTRRREQYGQGYALVDAAATFIHLSNGQYFDFPGPLEQLMEIVGQQVADRAVRERRDLVTELIGTDVGPVKQMIDALRAVGYDVRIEALQCDLQESIRRNEVRGDDNVSAYYAEPYQGKWLLYAAVWESRRRQNGNSDP